MAIITPLKKIFNWQLASEKIPYRVYTALISQTGTDAPTAIILKNTLGGKIVWTRANDGEYTGTLSGAFTAYKTHCILTMNSGGGLDVGQFVQDPAQTDEVSISTWSNNVAADDLLYYTPIEIRVYL